MKLPKIRVVYQSPKLFRNSGVFLKINDKRYLIKKGDLCLLSLTFVLLLFALL